jgi:hypothetical protein
MRNWKTDRFLNSEFRIAPDCPARRKVKLDFGSFRPIMYLMEYEIEKTEAFAEWFEGIAKADRTRLVSRIERIRNGNFGDHKEIAKNLFELRCFFGSGLRV